MVTPVAIEADDLGKFQICLRHQFSGIVQHTAKQLVFQNHLTRLVQNQNTDRQGFQNIIQEAVEVAELLFLG